MQGPRLEASVQRGAGVNSCAAAGLFAAPNSGREIVRRYALCYARAVLNTCLIFDTWLPLTPLTLSTGVLD